MIWEDIKIINDGDNIDRDFADKWEIYDYCNKINDSITISFVGVVVKNENILFSFPKHYEIEKQKSRDYDVFKNILDLIATKKISFGSYDYGIKGEFPLRAYSYILNYYKKYGLYKGKNTKALSGFGGIIDWNKTLNKSDKILQKNGVVFLPFIIKKKENIHVFLTECMNYILQDATKYKSFISFIFPYKGNKSNLKFKNIFFVLNELKKVKNNFFKDHEQKLIVNMIEYLEWHTASRENFRFLTLKFENYWQEIVQYILNNNFEEYDGENLIFGVGNKKFKSEVHDYVESEDVLNSEESKDRRNYYIKYDHILKDKSNKTIYLFDSKYFNDEITDLNYKQLFYHYHLKNKYKDFKIINGLILPTKKEYYSKIHIDRSDLDGVEIREHYINLEKSIKCFLKDKNR